MKKYWIPIIAVLAVAIIGVAVWLICFNPADPQDTQPPQESQPSQVSQVPPFTDEVKKVIKDANPSIIWYDENENVEEPGVWRYIGIYGDCYAFLEIQSPIGATFDPIELPYDIQGLSRPVSYSQVADVILYHTAREFTWEELHSRPDETGIFADYRTRKARLGFISNREDWITDAQLEQLTTDVEALSGATHAAPFTDEVKKVIKDANPSIIWYDENENVEEPGVWRYIGIYGDCYAFLAILKPQNAHFEPIELPYDIPGLSRPVSYPQVASVVLYHTTREFTWEELNTRQDETGSFADYRTRTLWLEFAKNREDWITDAQLEQLTADIEKMANGN